MNTILTSTSGGLEAAAIEPFFYSLRASGCKADVVVFAANISAECQALLKQYQATVVDFDYRGMPSLRSLSDRLRAGSRAAYRYYRRPRADAKEHAYLFFNNARFFCYRDYLLNMREKPGLVFLSDLRDVVFQTDPFSWPFQPGISVAVECTSRKIKDSWAAVKGLLESTSVRETCRLARHDIVCAGTTMADYGTMMKYLELMTAGINRRFFWGLLDGIDQGLHTYFTHNRLISPTHYYTNWTGPFLTMDSEVVLPKHKNAEGYLCNEDGSIVPIVHQYDRVKGLYQPGEKVPPCWKYYPVTR